MSRVAGQFFCVLALFTVGVSSADDVEFQDTPLLKSLFEATRDSDNDAIDRLLDSSAQAYASRSSDGRGLAWWAYEFQSAYVLAAIEAFGGNMESLGKDFQGQTADTMCTENPDCDKDALIKKAKALVGDIKKRKEQREKTVTAMAETESSAVTTTAAREDAELFLPPSALLATIGASAILTAAGAYFEIGGICLNAGGGFVPLQLWYSVIVSGCDAVVDLATWHHTTMADDFNFSNDEGGGVKWTLFVFMCHSIATALLYIAAWYCEMALPRRLLEAYKVFEDVFQLLAYLVVAICQIKEDANVLAGFCAAFALICATVVKSVGEMLMSAHTAEELVRHQAALDEADRDKQRLLDEAEDVLIETKHKAKEERKRIKHNADANRIKDRVIMGVVSVGTLVLGVVGTLLVQKHQAKPEKDSSDTCV